MNREEQTIAAIILLAIAVITAIVIMVAISSTKPKVTITREMAIRYCVGPGRQYDPAMSADYNMALFRKCVLDNEND